MKSKFDLLTADFTYIRWLGDRKGIEEQTKTWEKTVIDRRPEMEHWIQIFREFVARNMKIFAFANNN
jgi:hypothetical protein